MPRVDNGIARVALPGTCGELVQGTIGGVSFHVSCPIDCFSIVSVELTATERIWDCSADLPKAEAALRLALAHRRQEGISARMRIDSSLPKGKGMASSTADVAGAIYAAGFALGEPFDPREAADLALAIEPTDGSLFPGIVLFDHREGKLYKDLGPAPPLEVAVLDFGGEVNTIAFNRIDHRALLQELEPMVQEALEMVQEGLAAQDWKLLGKGATLSAIANQQILYKPYLEEVLHLAEELDALGVNVAHSGTVIGVLLDPRHHGGSACLGYLADRLPALEASFLCRLIDGGPRLLSSDPILNSRRIVRAMSP